MRDTSMTDVKTSFLRVLQPSGMITIATSPFGFAENRCDVLMALAADDIIEEAVQIFASLMSNGTVCGRALQVFCSCSIQHRITDASTIALVGGDVDTIPTLARAMIRPAALISGEMYGAVDNETGALLGFQIWLPPGQEILSTYVSKYQPNAILCP
jgi:hypothetical protein